ncbi:hypothetical protein [Idiomarina aminovorans]|uniref:hypothetical protein n=1 Tax=Idiomarina aminovorans TaxID=2914829 RepID=UPI002005A84B|nr:hypothetical protein [Idiomarina sp. ATCH4]MCK7458479.1 hypothetical protein [Idiomarina sp. ATCH4]
MRRISYQSIREHLEFNPERGSRETPYSPTNDQIKRLLRKLERYGWIERQHKNHLKENMVFRLVYASSESLRSNEERQGSAMRGAPLSAPQQNPVNTRAEDTNTATMSAKGAPWDVRHTSVTSDKDLSLTRAGATTGSDLTFTSEFLKQAKLHGPAQTTAEEIEAIFDHFRFHAKHHSTARSQPDWLAEWRAWIAREKVYATKQQRNTRSGAGGNQRPENPTAKLLRQSKEHSERLAATGYYDQTDESDDDTQF